MYEVYLTTGSLLSIVGLLTSTYLMYFFKQNKNTKSTILLTSQSISTILIGLFYIYSSIKMSNHSIKDVIKNVTFSNEIEQFDLVDDQNDLTSNEFSTAPSQIDVNKHEFDFINNFLIKYQQAYETIKYNRSVPLESYRKSKEIGDENLTICKFHIKFLQNATLVYAFVQGLIGLFIVSLDCKNCNVTNNTNPQQESEIVSASSKGTEIAVEDVENDIDAIVKTQSEVNAVSSKPNLNENKSTVKLLLLLFLMWLISPICLTSLYFIMEKDTSTSFLNKTLVQHYKTNVSLPAANVTTATKDNQVDTIIKSIYEIVKIKNNSHSVNYQMNESPKVETVCPNTNVLLKIYTIIIFIVGFVAVMLYSQTIYTSIKNSADELQVRNLKRSLISFGIFWLPSAVEMLSRTYLSQEVPGIVTEILSSLGNINNVVVNLGSVLITRSHIKKQNNVKPKE